jgi:Ca2+/Na+ antiporter
MEKYWINSESGGIPQTEKQVLETISDLNEVFKKVTQFKEAVSFYLIFIIHVLLVYIFLLMGQLKSDIRRISKKTGILLLWLFMISTLC